MRCPFHASYLLALLAAAHVADSLSTQEVQKHGLEARDRPVVMRKEQSHHPSERKHKELKSFTLLATVDDANHFLRLGNVEETISRGLANAFRLDGEVPFVKVVKPSETSSMLQQAAKTAEGALQSGRNAANAVQVAVEMHVSDAIKKHVASVNTDTIAQHIRQALEQHGKGNMNFAIASVMQSRPFAHKQHKTHRQHHSSILVSRTTFELIGEMKLEVKVDDTPTDPGADWAAGAAAEEAVCAGVNAAVTGSDCKVARYLQNNAVSRFQFKITIDDDEYDRTKYDLDHAIDTKEAEVEAAIQTKLGSGWGTGAGEKAVTLQTLKGNDQGRKPVYAGVYGSLIMTIADDAYRVMESSTTSAYRDAVKTAIGEAAGGVAATDILMDFKDATPSLLQIDRHDSQPNAKTSASVNCSFFIHSEKPWALETAINNFAKDSMRSKIHDKWAAATTDGTSGPSMPESITSFSAEQITADQAANIPAPRDFGAGGSKISNGDSDALSDVGGVINFKTVLGLEFIEDSAAQDAIKSALSDFTHVAMEEFTLDPDKSDFEPDPNNPLQKLPPVDTAGSTTGSTSYIIKFNWKCETKTSYAETCVKKLEGASKDDVLAKIRTHLGSKMNPEDNQRMYPDAASDAIEITDLTESNLGAHVDPTSDAALAHGDGSTASSL